MTLRVVHHGPLTRILLTARVAGRPVYRVSAYALGDTLVDSGCAKTAPELLAWARAHGIRRVVHTHHHEDHVGGDGLLASRLGVEILAPARAVPILDRYYRLPLYRRIVWGQPRNVASRPLGATVRIGELEFRVIRTPGHSWDHVCFFCPANRWLFSGDLFIAERVQYLRPVEDAHLHLDSLRRVADLDPALLVCSHAGVVEDARGALRRRIAHREELARRAEELRRRGLSPRRITRRLLGREGFMTVLSAGNFSKANLVRSLLKPRGCATVPPGG